VELDRDVEQKRATVEQLRDAESSDRKPFTLEAWDSAKSKSSDELYKRILRLEYVLEELEDEERQLDAVRNSNSQQTLRRATSLATNRQSVLGTLTEEEEGHIKNPKFLLSDDFCYGLNWDWKWHKRPMGPQDERHRKNCREKTREKVAKELGLRRFGDDVERVDPAKLRKEVGQTLHVWIDRTPKSKVGGAPAGDDYLLGRYDVVAAQVVADLDRFWKFYSGHMRPSFWVAHAAAINIGESYSHRSPDFSDFSQADGNANRLNEEAYYEAMRHVLENVTEAARVLKIKDFIFFPFGMGAFIRHLGLMDTRFQAPEEMQRLRRRLAREFLQVLSQQLDKSVSMHMCLSFSDDETLWNADAFLRALLDTEMKEFSKRVTVHAEGDCLDLAQTLADARAPGACDVMLVNGANRCLLGNHWFDGRAKRAIDENMHRRSWRMARTSYCVNAYGSRWQQGPRDPNCLEQTVKWLEGQVHVIDSNA